MPFFTKCDSKNAPMPQMARTVSDSIEILQAEETSISQLYMQAQWAQDSMVSYLEKNFM